MRSTHGKFQHGEWEHSIPSSSLRALFWILSKKAAIFLLRGGEDFVPCSAPLQGAKQNAIHKKKFPARESIRRCEISYECTAFGVDVPLICLVVLRCDLKRTDPIPSAAVEALDRWG